jgi:hypothetical protein
VLEVVLVAMEDLALPHIHLGQALQGLVFHQDMQAVAVVAVVLVVLQHTVVETVLELVKLHQQQLLTQAAVVAVEHMSTDQQRVTLVAMEDLELL